MKVPVYEPDTVAKPLDAPNVSVDLSPMAQQGRGLEQFGAQANEAQRQIVSIAQQEADRALTIKVANAETKYTSQLDALTNQLRTQKGLNALDYSSGAQDTSGQYPEGGAPSIYDQAQKAMDDALQDVPSGYARDIAAARMRGHLEQFHRSSEAYVDQQYRQGQEDALAGQKSAALRDAVTNYADPEALKRDAAMPQGLMGALSLSPEGTKADIAAHEAQVYGSAAQAALAKNDLGAAQKLLQDPAIREKLGPTQLPELDHRMTVLQQQLQGGQNAQALIDKTADPLTGLPLLDPKTQRPLSLAQRESIAVNEAMKLPETTLPEQATKERTREQLRVRFGMLHQVDEQNQEQALGRIDSYIERNGGSIDRSGADYNALDDRRKGQADAKALSVQRYQRGLNTQERRVQNETDRVAIATFAGMPAEDQVKANISQMFPDASPFAIAKMGIDQKKATQIVNKGFAVSDAQFKELVKAAAQSTAQGRTVKGRFTPSPDFVTAMVDWRNQYIQKHDAPPSRKDVDGAIADALLYGKTKGTLWDTSEYKYQSKGEFTPLGPEDQRYGPDKAPAPAPKTLTGFRFNGSRTMKKPVYSDGTEGPAEPANGR